MGVALGRVEEEVADPGAGYVLVFRGDVGEDDAGRYFRAYPPQRCFSEVFFAEVGEAEKPEDCFGNAG